MGPEVEYAAQNPDGPIELRIYRGADGRFDLYEDAGDSYDYEKGQHSVTAMRWDDAASTLTINAREGSFPNMSKNRVFRVVVVGSGHGVGEAVSASADREIHYDGGKVQVRLP